MILNKCCCCIELRTGCFLIAYLNMSTLLLKLPIKASVNNHVKRLFLKTYILRIEAFLLYYVQLTDVQNAFSEQPDYRSPHSIFTCNFMVLGALVLIGVSVIALCAEYSTASAALLLAIAILHLIFDIVLLVGLHKKKPGHLKAYMIFSVIFLVLFVISIIINLVSGKGSAHNYKPSGHARLGGHSRTIGSGSSTIVLGIYFLLVIRSMYYRMKEEKSRSHPMY